MNFFADEGLDFPIVYLLRVRGHKVIYAAEEYVSATDDVILDKAFETDSILITKDKDFGELRNSFTVIQENNIRTRPLEIKT